MKSKKISILGSGRVGASIAYTLTVEGTCSEIVLIDIAKQVAEGEAMDIFQGTPFSQAINVHSGEYSDVADSDIVIVTLGMARKPGQSRIELAQANVNIVKSVMPEVARYAPNAVYIVVSNPVDILTYAILQVTDLSPKQVIGSGTLLDSSRLKSIVADYLDVAPDNIHGYVIGEHGDSSVVPWSLLRVGGMSMEEYVGSNDVNQDMWDENTLLEFEREVRESGAKVIQKKGATNYAIAMSVAYLCKCILRDTKSILPVSTLMKGQYGMENVCLSLPCILGIQGLVKRLEPQLTEAEEEQLHNSEKVLKDIIETLEF